jgi:hypothetical protein
MISKVSAFGGRSHGGDVCLWKVASLAQYGRIARRGAGIRDAVAQVERGGLAEFAETLECLERVAAAAPVNWHDCRGL